MNERKTISIHFCRNPYFLPVHCLENRLQFKLYSLSSEELLNCKVVGEEGDLSQYQMQGEQYIKYQNNLISQPEKDWGLSMAK